LEGYNCAGPAAMRESPQRAYGLCSESTPPFLPFWDSLVLCRETISEPCDTENRSFERLYAGFLNLRSPANRYPFCSYIHLGDSRAKNWYNTHSRWNRHQQRRPSCRSTGIHQFRLRSRFHGIGSDSHYNDSWLHYHRISCRDISGGLDLLPTVWKFGSSHRRCSRCTA